MNTLTMIAATTFALLGPSTILPALTTSSFAQEWRDSEDAINGREMRDALTSHSEDRGYTEHRRDRDFDGLLRELGGTRGGGPGRGAAFFLRNGDATVAVRCDSGDSMRACVDATLTLLDKARAGMAQPSGTNPAITPPAR